MGPQMGIYNESNSALITSWNLGKIVSQVPSTVLTVNVWNNKGGSDVVSDLKNAYVAVVDYNGETAVDEVAKNKWIQVNIPSIDGDDTTYTPIGGAVTRDIRANGGITDNSATISGKPNNGLSGDSPSNVCTLNFIVVPPPNSIPGEKLFKIRIGGWFS